MSSQFSILDATPEDAAAFADLYVRAFEGDNINSYWVPPTDVPYSVLIPWLESRLKRLMRFPELHSTKLVDTATGKIVAAARWSYPHVLGDEEEAKRDAVATTGFGIAQTTWPLGENEELRKLYWGSLDDMEAKYVKKESMYGKVTCACD